MGGGGGGGWVPSIKFEDLVKTVAVGPIGIIANETKRAGENVKEELEKPMRDAEAAAEAEKKRMDALALDARKRQENEESLASATKVAADARKRQRQLASAGQGRRDTILTSPLGSVGGTAGPSKTLLGQ